MEFHPERLVAPPRGWAAARVTVSMAVAFAAIYAYYALVHDHATPFVLWMTIGLSASAVAEFLPRDRQYLAAAIRLTGIGILLALIVVALVTPEALFAS
jgi:hypothetical protein